MVSYFSVESFVVGLGPLARVGGYATRLLRFNICDHAVYFSCRQLAEDKNLRDVHIVYVQSGRPSSTLSPLIYLLPV